MPNCHNLSQNTHELQTHQVETKELTAKKTNYCIVTCVFPKMMYLNTPRRLQLTANKRGGGDSLLFKKENWKS